MSGSTITTTITNAVVLGTPRYATPLTITNAGAIEPVTLGAIGIYGPAGISGIAFSNGGIIDGDVGITGASSGSAGGTGGDAVYLHTGTAGNTGLITGAEGGSGGGGGTGGTGGIGLLLSGAAASLDNGGTISGGAGGTGGNHVRGFNGGNGGVGGLGVDLAGGETATNSGLIIGGKGGAGGTGGTHGSFDYSGGIGGNGGAGALVAGGLFSNSSTIIGGIGGAGAVGAYSAVNLPGTGGIGLSVTSGAIVVNNGTIIGGTGGSNVFNANLGNGTGAGEPGGAGVYISGGTLINDGTIMGGAAGSRSSTGLGVTLGPLAGNLMIDPGSTIVGQVLGNSTSDTLVLGPAPGSAVSTLHGFNEFFAGIYGSTYLDGINNLSFATGADWLVSGNFAETPYQNASFGSSGEPLDIKSITGFAVGDTLAVYAASAVGVTGYSFVTGVGLEVGHVTNRNVSFTSTYAIQGNFVTSDFQVSEPRLLAASGVEYDSVEITQVACFAAGTRILTAAGAVNVEALSIGDYVETLHAGLQKIKWIGQRGYAGRFISGNRDILPICIKRHAIAENIPARDLFVSPGHAICIDGALIHASRLVNGVSITQAASVESITYYHIETANHEVIFAENCPAETFIDENFRAQFQNAAQFHALYPGQNAAITPCLPLLQDGFALHAIQQRLNTRAGILLPPATCGALRGYIDEPGPIFCSGWAQDVATPETPVCLEILIDGNRIARVLANLYRADLRQAGLGSGCHAFRATLPSGLTGPLEIRRAVDGAKLSWTEAALAHAA